MSEQLFRKAVLKWCQQQVDRYVSERADCRDLGLERLSVEFGKILTGWLPFPNGEGWTWTDFTREIDVIIGLRVSVDADRKLIPLIVVELKSGTSLNTDELDKKSAVYGPLRELYPWVHTVFIHEDISERNLSDRHLLRNARHFHTIFKEWDSVTKSLFRKLIHQRLEYSLEYWKL